LSTIYKAKIIPFFYLLQLFFSNLLSRTQVNKKGLKPPGYTLFFSFYYL
jgi:hypothetical protein